jgi:membrane-bound serine protease (ClpP class)
MSALVWPLSLLAVGLLLVLAEAFVPSGGALLVLAVVCLGLSVWAAFRQSINLGLTFLLADAVLTPLTIALGLYLWQRSPLAARMTLKAPTSEEIAVLNTGRRVDHLVGERGHTLTPLRPSGTVEFEGRRLEGISEEGLIPEGSSVEAVSVRSGRLVVRRVALFPPAAVGPTGTVLRGHADAADPDSRELCRTTRLRPRLS